VLAVDQHTDTPKNGASLPGSTLTLEIAESDVATLAHARSVGGLLMVLRSYADIGGGAAVDGNGLGHSVRLFKGGAPAETVTAR
jgi:Flp pilus assembly protein CpaB